MSDDKEKSQSRDLDDDDEIPGSQVQETEPQSSCETFMSQQSENEELTEEQVDKVAEVSDLKSPETSALNSSLEANISCEKAGSSYTEKTSSPENVDGMPPEENPSITGEADREEKDPDDDGSFRKQETRKRKGRSDDSTPSYKRQRKKIQAEDMQEGKHSPESVFGEHSKKQDVSVMEISSTPEKTIVIDDSQEFSLRIEEGSPPTTQSGGDKALSVSQAASPTASVAAVLPVSPATSGTTVSQSSSQKSAVSWSSHTQDQILSWESHRGVEYKEVKKEESGNHFCDSGKDSSLDSVIRKTADNAVVKEVTETRTGQVAMIATVVWDLDNSNKIVSAKVKQLSLQDDYCIEKPGRMSVVSSTSTKSSSSTGSVGLPGPFPLPGQTVRSRLSTVSTISSTTSASQAWDPLFKRPFEVPGSKVNVTFSCEKCGHHFPPVDRSTLSSPVINGSPPVVEEEVREIVKSVTPKRGRKVQGSHAGSPMSSGPLQEETSSSGSQSQPQASSTPAKLPRGRPKKQQNGTVQRSAKKLTRSDEGNNTTMRTPRANGRTVRNGTPKSTKKFEKGEGEPVLARWGRDGRYYPGWVSEPLTAPQVMVHFCDGQSTLTASTKIVRANIITPGTLVLAATHSGDYEEALVVQVDSSGAEPVFMVERDKTQREVKFPSIALQQSTVLELTVSEAQKVTASTNFNDLSLENIVSHPRKRSARTPVEGSSGRKKKRQTTPQPCTSHGQTYNGPEETYGDTDSSTQSICSLDLRGKEVKPLDVECFPAESLTTKLLYNRGNMAFKKKEGITDEIAVKHAGPIPEAGSKLFTDCVFLITYTDKVKLTYEKYSSIEDSNVVDLGYTLWRDRLRMQIRNGGGKVYNSFSEVTKEELVNTYLITDKPCNTPLYLQCLVNNIPIYCHSLVIQCCTQNRPWKEVISGRGVKRMLAGHSLSRNCLVNPRSLIPLRGRTLLLALSGESSLSMFWQSLITKVGGSVDLYRGGSLEENKYDVVVTDTDCDRELVMEACTHRVPLVSTTWLQQVIITGEWRSPTEHPLYKYKTSDEREESPDY